MEQSNKIITFFSAKGGVGQTLISSNLANIASKRHPALFFQLTKYPDAHTFFDIDDQKNFVHIIDFLTNNEDLFHTFQTLTYPKGNLSIMLSPSDSSQTDAITPEHIAALLNAAQRLFPTIVIDLGREEADYPAILKLSDRIVTLSTLDPQSIARTASMLDTMQDTPPAGKSHLVINQNPDIIGNKEIGSFFGTEVFHTLSYDNACAWDNVAFSTPYSNTKSKLTKETEGLLDKLLA